MSNDPKELLSDIRTLTTAIEESTTAHHKRMEEQMAQQTRALTEIASGRFFGKKQFNQVATIALGVMFGVFLSGCVIGMLMFMLTNPDFHDAFRANP